MNKSQMRKMTACGGLVFCEGHGLLIRKHGLWDVPKGKLRRKEDRGSCATREISEETGLAAKLLTLRSPLCDSTYVAYYSGEPVAKTVHWFVLDYAGKRTDQLTPDRREDIDRCRWVQADQLDAYFRAGRPYLQAVIRAVGELMLTAPA